ncbi:LysE/ArgO family amino acid transporter [Citricoccus muralis]|uniref:L-lysine exporter family protein LysE/ArgO n=1 Tax=Citricoccus muralis TaxID=169134 RepID=A0A3D9LFL2_9MICC|nr:LysE family transporter [Citricoccus muralis]REE04454.1 L-lysine exporter family protein LysE/ArgO [Citricoccus muralis]
MTIFLTGLLTCLALIVAIGAQSLFIMRQAIRRDRLLLALAVCLVGDIVLITAGTAGVGVITENAPWLLEVLKWGGVAYLLWFAYSSFRSAFGARRSMAVSADDGDEADAEHVGGARPGAAVADDAGEGCAPGGEPALVGAGAGVGRGTGAAGGPATGTLSVVSDRQRLSVRMDRSGGRQRALTPVWTVVLTALSVSLLNPHAILDTVVMLGTLANSYGAEKWIFAGGALTGSAIWFLTLGFGVRALAPLLDTPRTWKMVDIVVGSVMVFIAGSLAFG